MSIFIYHCQGTKYVNGSLSGIIIMSAGVVAPNDVILSFCF